MVFEFFTREIHGLPYRMDFLGLIYPDRIITPLVSRVATRTRRWTSVTWQLAEQGTPQVSRHLAREDGGLQVRDLSTMRMI